ncbi:MAG: ATP-grasp domain-containing protein [Acidobacteria bacterium]|nr:ATP-grasp domain-containing protein [Acidobacteriota bacterium]
MLLLPTTTYRAHDFLEAARRLGVESTVGSERRQAFEGLQPAGTLTVDIASPAKAADQIVRFALTRPLRAIVPTDDATAVVAAEAASRLGMPHNPPAAAGIAGRKDLLRTRLQDAGVRTPRHRVHEVRADEAAAAREAPYPCVLKPLFLSGSRGVIRADTPVEFASAFCRIRDLLARPEIREKDPEAARGILVEEFAPGAEVALEGLLSGGRLKVLAIFDKPDPLDGPFFEETIYVTPSRLPAGARRRLVRSAAAAARAVGLVEGPIHAELRVDGEEVTVIEMAARSIGGLCSRALRFGTGRSLEELILMHALGRDVARLERERRPSGVMMIPIPRAGTLREVRGLGEARAVPGIVDLSISATLGRPLVPLPEGSSYLGFLFARGSRPDEVEEALREAHRRLEFIIEDRE